MDKPKRPGPVTAVAVLCLIFGGAGLVLYLCAMGSFGLVGYLFANPPPVQPGQPDLLALFRKIDQIVPNFKYYLTAASIITWLLCLVEVIAGLKLLKMRYSGRWLAIAYAACAIVMELASLGMNLAFIEPHSAEMNKAVMDWMQEATKQPGGAAPAGAPPAGPPPAAPVNPFASNPALNAVMSVGGLAVGLLYPGIIIFIMMMPKTRRAFAVANGDAPPGGADEPDVVRPAGAKDEPPAVSAPEDEYRYQARDE